MKNANRSQVVTDLMIANLKTTLEELVSRYNTTGSKATYQQIRAVRAEIEETARGE